MSNPGYIYFVAIRRSAGMEEIHLPLPLLIAIDDALATARSHAADGHYSVRLCQITGGSPEEGWSARPASNNLVPTP